MATTRVTRYFSGIAIAVFVPIAVGACGLLAGDGGAGDGDDLEPGTDGDGVNEVCVELAEDSQDLCPFWATPMLESDLEGGTYVDIEAPAGLIPPVVIGEGGVKWVVGGDESCILFCVVPPGSPCFGPGNVICGECETCGPAAGGVADCEQACANGSGSDDGPMPDSTGDADGPMPDSSSGDDGAPISEPGLPDVDWLSDHTPSIYYTSQSVLDRLGGDAPSNLAPIRGQDACDEWLPQEQVIASQGGLFSLHRSARDMLADRGEFILTQCDQMRVALSNDGVVLTRVEPRSLAGVLGLDVGDVIVQINGTSTLDVAALLVEFDRIRTSGGPATIEYRGSDGNRALIKVNVQ